MDREETKKILAGIAGVYPNTAYNAASVEMWLRILEPFSYSAVQEACLEFFRTSAKFPPLPGEIFQTLKRDIKSHTIGAEDAFIIALGYSSPYKKAEQRSAHPRIIRVMQSIGWDRLANASLETEVHWIKKEFIQAYQAILDSEIEENLPDILNRIREKKVLAMEEKLLLEQ